MTFYLALACRGLLAAVFAVAAGSKVWSFHAFSETLPLVDRLPAPLRRTVAPTVVAAEAIAVILLATPGLAVAGLLLTAALLLTFTGVVMRERRQGRKVVCRCFGAGGGEMGRSQLARNGVLLAIAAVGAVAQIAGGGATTGGTLVAVSAGVVAGVLISRWDDLAFLVRG